MSTFKRYAGYYDALYRDKDYTGEAAFVRSRILNFAPGARSILELGCGTARHAMEFVRLGWRVRAVDRSRHMVRQAKAERDRLGARLRSRLRLDIGDVTRYRAHERFDAVTSLFHVVNYQTTTAGLLGLFRSARISLRAGGLFMFDFWYGPAVRAEPPAIRIKRVRQGSVNIVRLAEPVHHVKRHCVEVNYTLLAVNRRSGRSEQIEETHVVRYLFLPEIKRLGTATGFRMIESGQWLTRKPLTTHTWTGYAILRAVDGR